MFERTMSPASSTAPSKPGMHPTDCFARTMSPLASTAPSTPGQFPADLGSIFKRTMSPASSTAPSTPPMLLWDLNACRLTRTISGDSTEVDGAWLEPTFSSRTFSGNIVMEWEEWNATTGQGLAQQKSNYDKRLDSMLSSLSEAKNLYTARYGRSLSDVGEHEEVYDADGMRWKVVVGRGAVQQKANYEEKLDDMNDSLAQINSLFEAKYGCGYEEEDDDEQDDAEDLGRSEVGRGAACQKQFYDSRIDALLSQLEEVKKLHFAEYGRRLDDVKEEVEVYDVEGTAWKHVAGQGATQQKAAYEENLKRLDGCLEEVKELFGSKYGYSIDDDEKEEETGSTEVGQGFAHQKKVYNDRIDTFSKMLEEVKELHAAKYGRTLADIEATYDSDGMPWNVTVGQGISAQQRLYEERLESLGESLAEVKVHYKAKHHSAFDSDDEDDETGCLEIGRGFAYRKLVYDARLDALMARVEDVSPLHKANYGRSIDDLEEDEEEAYDCGGTAWHVVSGPGFATEKAAYEEKLKGFTEDLDEAKILFATKYGYSADAESEEEVLDNLVWNDKTGEGLAHQKQRYEESLGALTKQLEEVKRMHVAKYGEPVSDLKEPAPSGMVQFKTQALISTLKNLVKSRCLAMLLLFLATVAFRRRWRSV